MYFYIRVCVCVFKVRSSQALRSGKYAAMIMADRNCKNGNGVNGQVDDDDDFSKFSRNQRKSKELVVEPMDYPDTVAAVFKYGARGRFASWSSFARYEQLYYVFYIRVQLYNNKS